MLSFESEENTSFCGAVPAKELFRVDGLEVLAVKFWGPLLIFRSKFKAEQLPFIFPSKLKFINQ